ncbi:unnamed protein product, partial [Protopolystoma xenopodis]
MPVGSGMAEEAEERGAGAGAQSPDAYFSLVNPGYLDRLLEAEELELDSLSSELDEADWQAEPVDEMLDLIVYRSTDEYFPSLEAWQTSCERRTRLRLAGVSSLFCCCALLLGLHLRLAGLLATRSGHSQADRLHRHGRVASLPADEDCFVVACARVCPEPARLADWVSVYNLPYATLAESGMPLSDAVPAGTPSQCYAAFWR